MCQILMGLELVSLNWQRKQRERSVWLNKSTKKTIKCIEVLYQNYQDLEFKKQPRNWVLSVPLERFALER